MLTDIEIITFVTVVLSIGFALECVIRRIIGFAISGLVEALDNFVMYVTNPKRTTLRKIFS